jgi:hypothetical protein
MIACYDGWIPAFSGLFGGNQQTATILGPKFLVHYRLIICLRLISPYFARLPGAKIDSPEKKKLKNAD